MKVKLNLAGWIFFVLLAGMMYESGDLVNLVINVTAIVVVYKCIIKPLLSASPEPINSSSKSKPKMPDSLAKKLARRNNS